MVVKDFLETVFPTTSEEERQKAQEEKTHKRLLDIEKHRKIRELYAAKEISNWMLVGPFLGVLVAALAGFMLWASGGADDMQWLWWVVGIGIAPLILFGATTDLDEKWKESVAAKEELHAADPRKDADGISRDFSDHDRLLHGHRYKYDHLYTDSVVSYWLYKLAKFVAGLSTIVFGGLTAWLLFVWLGSISIAPTTVIIFLLVLILLKMK